jgi:endogenous inhibitor of DNA gyrase (YacG/DUF329 family)
MIVRCPSCGSPAAYTPENAFRPFCSERCKLTDLGAWAEEKYAIADPAYTSDVSKPSSEDHESNEDFDLGREDEEIDN